MKTSIFLIIVAFFPAFFPHQVAAQDGNGAKTLLGSGSSIGLKDLGFFLSPAYGLTQMDGSSTSLFNLRGGVTLGDQFALGASWHTSVNEIMPQPNVYMDYWMAGGFMEYTLFAKKLIHFTFPLFIGYGEVEMDDERGNPGLGEANFFQIEPSASLEINLHRYMRLNIGTGYRFVGPMNYRNFDQSDISGLTGYLGLKFGLFR